MAQAARMSARVPTWRATTDGFMKIPDATIPLTIMVASKSSRRRARCPSVKRYFTRFRNPPGL